MLWSVNIPNVSFLSSPYLNSANMSSPRPVKRGHEVYPSYVAAPTLPVDNSETRLFVRTGACAVIAAAV